jgi:hypothetical protein
VAGAEDQLRWAQQSAYGTSFPTETKRFRAGGWYFSMDQAFDLAVSSDLDNPPLKDPLPRFLEVILGNLNYEGGCNPVNVSYVTGLGWKRPRDIVHHYAMNDRRQLPPSGLPIGNIQRPHGSTFIRRNSEPSPFRWMALRVPRIPFTIAGATASTCKRSLW